MATREMLNFAGKRNLKMDRDPCAHLSAFIAFWLLFAIFAGSCTRNWFARDRQKATKIFFELFVGKTRE
jgi:hypothetical protein